MLCCDVIAYILLRAFILGYIKEENLYAPNVSGLILLCNFNLSGECYNSWLLRDPTAPSFKLINVPMAANYEIVNKYMGRRKFSNFIL